MASTDTDLDLEIPRPKRGEGQWGLGYREPLNPAEQIKKEDDGLNVRERIERIFAPEGFRSIGKQDLREPHAVVGSVHPAQTQGVPGERTGSAEPEELEDEFFMMRIRIDGGAMTSEQLRAIAWASERYGRDVADVTDRQNVQLHWIRIEDVPAIWERIESVGLLDAGSLRRHAARDHGVPARRRHGRRGVRRDARHQGRRRALRRRPCLLEPSPQVQDVDQRLPPRSARTTRSTTCRSWASRDRAASSATTCRSAVACRRTRCSPSGSARSCRRERVPEVWAGVTSLFREYGYRRSRNHSRLKFLVKDWGPERVREVLQEQFLEEGPLADGPPPTPALRWARASTWASCRSGTAGCRWGSPRGPGASPDTSCASSPSWPSVRLGLGASHAQQKLVIVDVEAARADERRSARRRARRCARVAARSAARRWRAPASSSASSRSGRRRAAATWLTTELEARLPDFERGRAHPRERLPELVRAVPGRRHRADGRLAGAAGRHEERRLPRAPRGPMGEARAFGEGPRA